MLHQAPACSILLRILSSRESSKGFGITVQFVREMNSETSSEDASPVVKTNFGSKWGNSSTRIACSSIPETTGMFTSDMIRS